MSTAEFSSIVTLRTDESHPAVLFVFVFNEGRRLLAQLERLPPPGERGYDVMIGDDGSTDGSVSEDALRRFDIRGVVRLPRNQGLSANIKAGLGWLLASTSYQGVVMMNGNDRDDPEAVPRFLAALDEGYDYVQGSRFLPGGTHANTPALRYYGIRFVHAPLFSLAAGQWFTDTTNGFRAFSRCFLAHPDVRLDQDAFQKYELEQYLAWKAVRLGMRCAEIPVARRYEADRDPATFSKIRPGIGYWEMIKPLLMLLLRRYD